MEAAFDGGTEVLVACLVLGELVVHLWARPRQRWDVFALAWWLEESVPPAVQRAAQ